jgi:hypothetical protein
MVSKGIGNPPRDIQRLLYLRMFFPILIQIDTLMLFFELLNGFEHVGISVRDTVRNVNLITFFLGFDIETEGPAFNRPWIK